MSLDPKFLETGKYDNERNSLAFQVAYLDHPNGIEIDENGDIANAHDVILDLSTSVSLLTRAVAVLEDQIAELRGSRALPKDVLIHAAVGPNDQPAPNTDEAATSWVDSAVIDPSIDS